MMIPTKISTKLLAIGISSLFSTIPISFYDNNNANFPTILLSATEQIQPPTDKDNQLVQMAFKDFDLKRFDDSEKEFTIAITRWQNELHRPRDEVVSLIKARASVRLDNKLFESAISDYNSAIDLMKVDGENKDTGRAKYPEYPDAFVGRALAKEGLADWKGALDDYNKAIFLWGGKVVNSEPPSTGIPRELDADDSSFNIKDYDGINPYVLTFRGNVLCKLNNYADAAVDYKAASNIFSELRDIPRYSDARSNYALALYELHREDESVKIINDIIRKNPGYADMHVALAAHYWGEGNYIGALKEWQFTCDRIDVGCEAYKDINWVTTVRRWPTSLASKLSKFLNRELPEKLLNGNGMRLAPSPSKA